MGVRFRYCEKNRGKKRTERTNELVPRAESADFSARDYDRCFFLFSVSLFFDFCQVWKIGFSPINRGSSKFSCPTRIHFLIGSLFDLLCFSERTKYRFDGSIKASFLNFPKVLFRRRCFTVLLSENTS